MKKMAFLLLISFVSYCFFCLACNMVPENKHICVNKGIIHLLTLSGELGLVSNHLQNSLFERD